MKTIEIYASSIISLPGEFNTGCDPDLARLALDLEWLKKSDVRVVTHNIGQRNVSFILNVEVGKLLRDFGSKILPITVVDGKVLKSADYPTKEEFVIWLDD